MTLELQGYVAVILKLTFMFRDPRLFNPFSGWVGVEEQVTILRFLAEFIVSCAVQYVDTLCGTHKDSC